MATAFDAFYIRAASRSGGQRFCVHHAPRGLPARGVVLYVHPFAEELNKSRRMAAMASRAMAQAGFAVLQIDLLGCGDSSGELSDAGWSDWIEDALLGADWLMNRYPGLPMWWWGLRAGALVASQAAQMCPRASSLLLWQPALSGKLLLNQFLRLNAAAAGLLDGSAKEAMARSRQALAAGDDVGVAGYRLPAAVAVGLEQAVLQLPERVRTVRWLEVVAREPAELLPASLAQVDKWNADMCDAQTWAVSGPAFWQTQEIEDAPVLVYTTVRALLSPAGLKSGE
ncbi:hydrolase 2, exosortase A system-associated [Rubrivivax sp. RP6-9]|uniref:hydrolase 2, exosortase A system-associated n=1 Tax=Rubrivivax sp. RP6-9 TaxID=3415750 RepID=UPI003CC5187E